jgi:ATP-binding cassette, subfamily B, bacterial HlyB/CyaB
MQEYQKAVLSLKLQAQLMQTNTEPASSQLAPEICGEIEFEEVTFHDPGSPSPALRDLSFAIEPG